MKNKEILTELNIISNEVPESGIDILELDREKIASMIISLKDKLIYCDFIEGEIVKYGEDYINMIGEFIKFTESYNSNEYPFIINQHKRRKCEKIEKLPMHMTVFDGTNKPKNDNDLVIMCFSENNYSGGFVKQFSWDSTGVKFQLLEDLER